MYSAFLLKEELDTLKKKFSSLFNLYQEVDAENRELKDKIAKLQITLDKVIGNALKELE